MKPGSEAWKIELARLIAAVSNAHFDCGEWGDESEDGEGNPIEWHTVYLASQKAYIELFNFVVSSVPKDSSKGKGLS